MKQISRYADICWQEGVPVANAFDDPYYSRDDGLAESRFVFLEGASILERANAAQRFVVAETGFGTGLNFLATWQAWRASNTNARLIFVSAEAYPMSTPDMEKAHAHFPELADLSRSLRDAMPPPSNGFHIRHFDGGNVSLLLMYGAADNAYANLNAQVDAWYLDGFAPARNPSMWTDKLFREIARLSSVGTTLATFTAAGFVRRGLADVGFDMKKTAGFGRKRERLVGTYKRPEQPAIASGSRELPEWSKPLACPADRVAIVGGGIAAASLASAFRLRGVTPTVVRSPTIQPASSLPAAILAPRFMLDDTPERDFFSSAFAQVVSLDAYRSAMSPVKGIVLKGKKPEDFERFERIIEFYGWPKDWMDHSAEGLVLPRGATVTSQKVLEALFADVPIINTQVAAIVPTGESWQLRDESNQNILEAECVVVATGMEASKLLSSPALGHETGTDPQPMLRPVIGQIEIAPSSNLTGLPPETLSYGGYVSAETDSGDGQAIRTIGTTFKPQSYDNQTELKPTTMAQEKILEDFFEATGGEITDPDNIRSWAGWRATVSDHLPYAGPVPDWGNLVEACAPLAKDASLTLNKTPRFHDGLYCLTGLGSKGFQYGPLLGDYLAAMILSEPSPIPADMAPRLHPGRAAVRSIVRGPAKG